jgi:uncharacterized Zn finger protein (UPF0148 family)
VAVNLCKRCGDEFFCYHSRRIYCPICKLMMESWWNRIAYEARKLGISCRQYLRTCA